MQRELPALEDRGGHLRVLVEEGRRGVPGQEAGRAQDRGQRLPVGRHPGHPQPLEAGRQRGRGDLAGGSVGDHLGQHRVVEGADLGPGLHAGLDPDARGGVGLEALDPTHARQVAAGRVLGVEPHLDRVPGARDLLLRQRQRLARGDPDLPLDEVQAGDLLGDRVLDLQAGVHLQEEELLGLRPRRPP